MGAGAVSQRIARAVATGAGAAAGTPNRARLLRAAIWAPRVGSIAMGRGAASSGSGRRRHSGLGLERRLQRETQWSHSEFHRCRSGGREGVVAAGAATKEGILQTLEESLGSFSAEPSVPAAKPRLIVISGGSGVGKDAVVRRLQEMRPELYFVVTATNRAKREAEVEGVDYFFVTTEEFEKMIAEDELLEHALVYGSYKGIPKEQVRQALSCNTDVVLRLDVQGAATIRQMIPQCISIFLVAESERALVERLVARETETVDELLVRMQTAREEMARYKEFDYVIPNASGKLDETAAMIGAIIDTEKRRTCVAEVQL